MVGIHAGILRPCHYRQMRRVKPDNAKKGLLFLRCSTHEGNGPVHNDARIIPPQVFTNAPALFIPVASPVGNILFRRVPPLFAVVALGSQHGVPGGHLGFSGKANIKPIGLRGREMSHSTRPAPVGILLGLGEGAQVPLAEVTGSIPVFFEQLC